MVEWVYRTTLCSSRRAKPTIHKGIEEPVILKFNESW